jgi:hypothetical protein
MTVLQKIFEMDPYPLKIKLKNRAWITILLKIKLESLTRILNFIDKLFIFFKNLDHGRNLLFLTNSFIQIFLTQQNSEYF